MELKDVLDVAGRFDVLVKESHLNRTAYFTSRRSYD